MSTPCWRPRDDWQHDPWSADVADGFLWGRGALDMKSQVAAEAVAAVALARDGWRPERGALKLVFVADEETGGEVGARWLTEQHPDKVRCDLLLNEGAGSTFELGGVRHYGVCCGEKGIFRLKLTASGMAGHASMPRLGENALLKLAPVLEALRPGMAGLDPTEIPLAMIEALGEDPSDPAGALERLTAQTPLIMLMLEPLLAVTMTPTVIHASDKINVIPASAYMKVDTRVPPGLGADVAKRRMLELLGDAAERRGAGVHRGGLRLRLARVLNADGRDRRLDLERTTRAPRPCRRCSPATPTRAISAPPSRTWSPTASSLTSHQTLLDTAPLVHNKDERIDVRDLGYATQFYADIARELLG